MEWPDEEDSDRSDWKDCLLFEVKLSVDEQGRGIKWMRR